MADRRKQCKVIAELPYIKCTYSHEWEEFRVTLVGLSKTKEEAVAYYCSDFEDAHCTAIVMSETRVTQINSQKEKLS